LPPVIVNEPESCGKFWTEEIKRSLESRFNDCLQATEQAPETDLRHFVNFKLLIERFQTMTGVQFSNHLSKYKQGEFLTIKSSDIIGLNSRVSFMQIIEYADAISTLLQIQKNPTYTKEELESLKTAEDNLSRSIKIYDIVEPSDCYFLGTTYLEIALRSK